VGASEFGERLPSDAHLAPCHLGVARPQPMRREHHRARLPRRKNLEHGHGMSSNWGQLSSVSQFGPAPSESGRGATSARRSRSTTIPLHGTASRSPGRKSAGKFALACRSSPPNLTGMLRWWAVEARLINRVSDHIAGTRSRQPSTKTPSAWSGPQKAVTATMTIAASASGDGRPCVPGTTAAPVCTQGVPHSSTSRTIEMPHTTTSVVVTLVSSGQLSIESGSGSDRRRLGRTSVRVTGCP